MNGLFLSLLLLASVNAGAGELAISSVTRNGDAYTIVIDLYAEAPPAAVRRIVTDYAHLERVNDAIDRSEILAVHGPRHHRVRADGEACILFFCRRLVLVQDVRQLEDGDIVASVLPGPSDFERGRVLLRILAERGGTRMRLSAEVIPKFWVPPLIGPWLIQAKLGHEALESARNLERLAREAQ